MIKLTIQELWRSVRALTLLDMILAPKDGRHHPVMDASCKDGQNRFVLDSSSGRLWVIFTDDAVVIRGCGRSSEDTEDSSALLFKDMPEGLLTLFDEAQRRETTFCMWQTEGVWHQNKTESDGGEAELMGYIFTSADRMQAWAEEHYGRKLDDKIMKKLFDKAMLTADEMKALSPECRPREVMAEFFSRTVSGR